jgi:hypothetical protein
MCVRCTHLRREPDTVHHPRLTFANVLSCLALFVALGGASYAATSLPTNSVGAMQIKSGAIDNSKIKAGSLHRSAFKPGQLKAGPRGKVGKAGAVGVQGLAGVAGTGIKLAGYAHYAALDVAGDSQWHTYNSVNFTAAANTIYWPNYYTDYTAYRTTGASCSTGLGTMSRELVNGVSVSPVDSFGYTRAPEFYGPYAAGTPINLQLQYNQDCVTQVFHLPAGDLMLIPYQTS